MQKIYLKSLKEKHELLKNRKSPKVILVGGSNLAFGINSCLIHKILGYNIINMGFHAGIGLRFMCNHVKPFIKKNDIVIIAPSYICFSNNNDYLNGVWVFLEVLSHFRKGFKYLDAANLRHVGTNFFNFRKEKKRNSQYQNNNINQSNIYYNTKFNCYGDFISHLCEKSKSKLSGDLFFPINKKGYNTKTTSFLNNFKLFAEKRGVEIFFIFLPIPENIYKKNENGIIDLYNWLLNNLNINILGSPEKYVFPKELFFDNIYHLNKKGRNIRTNRIIEELKKYITISGASSGNCC